MPEETTPLSEQELHARALQLLYALLAAIRAAQQEHESGGCPTH
jgi:hypothetical protein